MCHPSYVSPYKVAGLLSALARRSLIGVLSDRIVSCARGDSVRCNRLRQAHLARWSVTTCGVLLQSLNHNDICGRLASSACRPQVWRSHLWDLWVIAARTDSLQQQFLYLLRIYQRVNKSFCCHQPNLYYSLENTVSSYIRYLKQTSITSHFRFYTVVSIVPSFHGEHFIKRSIRTLHAGIFFPSEFNVCECLLLVNSAVDSSPAACKFVSSMNYDPITDSNPVAQIFPEKSTFYRYTRHVGLHFNYVCFYVL